MSHLWDPLDPHHGRSRYRGRSNRSVGIVLLVLTALIAGGLVSYVVTQWQDARSDVDALPTLAPTSSPPTTIATTTTTTLAPSTAPTSTTTTIPPTTTSPPVVGDHMVFADGHGLGQVTPTGFVAYQGDPSSQLRQGTIEVASVVNFIGATFNVQVRPLDPTEMSATCPVAVEPRAADNAEPLGLWVESPNWTLEPAQPTPVAMTDPGVQAVVQLITTSGGVQPAPPPQRGSAIMVDLIGDGVPDLVVSATYSDDIDYYRMIAVAPDGNPDAATPVMLEFGPTFAPDGSRDPQSRGELRVDGVVEMTGAPPFELLIRRTTGDTRGVTIRDLTGAQLGGFTCPR